MRYAVGCADLMCHPQRQMLMVLLQPVLTTETASVDAQAIDGMVVLIREDCSPERWAAIVKIVREVKGINKNQFRLYESKAGAGGWHRV